MAQTCSRCSRVNPPEAAYCFFDGNLLAGHAPAGGAIASGTAAFPNAFVFPSGRSCRNFDELALAIQNDWNGAKELAQQGFLESFLSGLGRADLAIAAREAARYPDRDRGLDQFLAKLPTNVLQPPKLQVERSEFNLGTIAVGADQKLNLRLENIGMRLLYGSISCGDCLWLSLGDAPGAPEKMFQFGADTTIPIHVRGKHLRAGNKPLEGQLVIESSGGSQTITFKAEVPVKPFATGVLSGAKSPRQVAEKAKGSPKEAAALFEKGAVAKWYEENGWKYPVQGPSSSGLGAVQQFFEALGLTPPPKVEISERSVALQGNVGDALKHVLEVKAQEKRPVYAHATSNQPWLEVGRAKLNGRTATIPLVIPSVPDRQGETLTAKVLVTSNGNQRFVVPVTLVVGGSFIFDGPVVKEASIIEIEPAPMIAPAPQPMPSPTAAPPRQQPSGFGIHALPALLLALTLVGIIIWDVFGKKDGGGSGGGGGVSLGNSGRRAGYTDLLDRDPQLGIDFQRENRRFGLVMTKAKDPLLPDAKKKLTYRATGETNNTCIKVDGHEHLFGGPSGKLDIRDKKSPEREQYTDRMYYAEHNLYVTQIVELVPGAQTRLLDTCLVTYEIENKSKTSHTVGLRIMLDTFIGANDGVPFAVPGQPGLLTTFKEFPQKDIPDYIQALERDDLANPGTVAHMGLKVPEDGYEAVWKMLITHYPDNENIRWEVPLKSISDAPPDSCVVLYWAEQVMNPGEKRKMGFTYGLNTISSIGKTNSELSITVGGNFRPKKEFTVTAYIKNGKRGQKVKINLPKGLNLVKGQEAEQELDSASERSQVSWKVTADEAKDYELSVNSKAETEGYRIKIRESSIFD